HASVTQVGACLDGCHGDEPDARVLELLADGVAEHGTDRLVDATHATAAHPRPRTGSTYPRARTGQLPIICVRPPPTRRSARRAPPGGAVPPATARRAPPRS